MTGVEDWNQYRAGRKVTGSGPMGGSTFSENPRARQVFTGKGFTRRKRMTADERRDQIVKAAVKVIAAKGFWGMSLQDVADQVGITEAALYHYIDSKNDLFSMVMEQAYDSPEADEFIYKTCTGTDADGHDLLFFPRFCANNVIFNARRPEMVKLFSILNGEALSPSHPAHRYFIGRNQKFWQTIKSLNWCLPRGYDLDRFHHMWMLCMSAMDGLQYRWLADGSADLVAEWLAFSDELFPQEKWHGFMDPSDIDPDSEVCLASYGLITGGEQAVQDRQLRSDDPCDGTTATEGVHRPEESK